MHTQRTLIRDHHKLALLLMLCALVVKAVVPQGYMIGQSSTSLTVQLCTDGSGVMKTQTIEIPMKKGSSDQSGGHGKTDGTCAFSSLAMGGITGADAALLATALAFILLLGFASATLPCVSRHHHLRPPLRGPPATA